MAAKTPGAKSKVTQLPSAAVDGAEQARGLNERARLYPWESFNQGELELMTGFPRQAISAAFASPDFPSQFGRSRPEDVFAWVRLQDAKIQTKEAKTRVENGSK